MTDHPLIIRRDAAQAAIERFENRPLAWSTNDCVRLAAFTLRRLGHRPPMPKAGSYKTLLAARKALKAAGFETLEAALDGLLLPRIAPAAALPADIVAMPSPVEGWLALTVALGNGRLLGFLDDPEGGPPICRAMQPTFASGAMPIAAWRCEPCRK